MFPSPIGELHFSINYKGCKSNGIVSVPYRGATFLNNNKDTTYTEGNNMFPSPIGELHFSIVNFQISSVFFSSRFRPLSGSYISQSVTDQAIKAICSVSVPYRGATFLNAIRRQWKRSWTAVSVPYRGATFLNALFTVFVKNGCGPFPSPIGELHFSISVVYNNAV